MTAAEPVQKLGLVGVARVKRWLEATTYLEMPFDVYNNPRRCSLPYKELVQSELGEQVEKRKNKLLDLAGYYLQGDKDPVWVESKNYSTPGGQYSEFQRLLAIIYSATALEIEDFGNKQPAHFFWVTSHPFSLGRWSMLEHHEEVQLALDSYPAVLLGKPVDEDLKRRVADSTTVLVMNPKQEKLSLTQDEVGKIRHLLDRKGNSL